jgi:hypothetical protein
MGPKTDIAPTTDFLAQVFCHYDVGVTGHGVRWDGNRPFGCAVLG